MSKNPGVETDRNAFDVWTCKRGGEKHTKSYEIKGGVAVGPEKNHPMGQDDVWIILRISQAGNWDTNQDGVL